MSDGQDTAAIGSVRSKQLFVIMPFGMRKLQSGAVHDFDRFYQDVLRPVAAHEGWSPMRADEIAEPGMVINQAFRHLHSADTVIADLSPWNGSVYLELGVRLAISPGNTILIALSGTDLPFDIKGQRVLFYSPNFDQDVSFRRRLRQALRSDSPMENPVWTALHNLGLSFDPRREPLAFERELNHKIERSRNVEQLVAVWHWARSFPNLPTGPLLSLSERLASGGDFQTAVAVLDAVADSTDYEVHRQRGFYLRKIGELEPALAAFETALGFNRRDPETLGMMGGALKRLGRYTEALDKYEEGATLSPTSLYLAVARAGMAIIASPDDPEPGLELYRELLVNVPQRAGWETDSWANLVCAEASFVLGDVEAAYRYARAAVRYDAERLHLTSTAEQIAMLAQAGLELKNPDGFVHWLTEVAHREEPVAVGGGQEPWPDDSTFQRRMIFHISDIHFGSITRDGEVIDTHGFYDGENSNRLSVELTNEFQAALRRSDCMPENALLVVSGDSTYTGRRVEFEKLHDFLTELCGNLGLHRSQVAIVPGNHDIDWLQTRSDRANRFDNYLSFAHRFYGEELFRELFPLISWDMRTNSVRPRPNDIVYRRTDGTLTIVGLNSCIFEDDQNHYGYIGKRQLDKVARLLENEPSSNVRVAVMHHHLHPFPEPLEPRRGDEIVLDVSTVRDAGVVEQRLERLGFSLLLHGHKHKPQLRETLVRDPQMDTTTPPRLMIVSGCGSTGVSEHELEHSQPNHYAILEVLQPTRAPGVDFVAVEWREHALSPGADWVTKQRWTLKG
ncbi:metallophosphoesterase [Plantactinospora sp. KBS50]|uniref:metallophosphoesterase n=1 Tax=Plantactinospora sp. KBS50 TaxID=2024580 RepID=UPI000BAAC585|nr:metallophosphoesterase [Plantactinospora sp. KBS50]ASW53139.1 hypothetical protein CIK06_01475 [Plantactinospora sp. KBS50]